ncbi:hypothetical protein H8959_019589 [Pygathrix nigripes]
MLHSPPRGCPDPAPLTCQAQLDEPVPVSGGGRDRDRGDGEARWSHHSGWGLSSRRRDGHGLRVPDVPSVVAKSRGGTRTPRPFPPLVSVRPSSRLGWSAEAGGVRRRRSRTVDSAASSSIRPPV